MDKETHLLYMFGFLEVNGMQIYPFYPFSPPPKHGHNIVWLFGWLLELDWRYKQLMSIWSLVVR